MYTVQRLANEDHKGEYINYNMRRDPSNTHEARRRTKEKMRHISKKVEQDGFTRAENMDNLRESTADKLQRKEKERIERLNQLKEEVSLILSTERKGNSSPTQG